MKTLVMHIATQIAIAIERIAEKDLQNSRILVTGGGAFNRCLVDYIKSETEAQIIVPDVQMVNYKEAMIFALLGAMRVQNICNTLPDATGASAAFVGGSLDGNFSKLI
jgi:anhydro-N-acetylmuramic acid kinase